MLGGTHGSPFLGIVQLQPRYPSSTLLPFLFGGLALIIMVLPGNLDNEHATTNAPSATPMALAPAVAVISFSQRHGPELYSPP